jgi:hypothetical protein
MKKKLKSLLCIAIAFVVMSSLSMATFAAEKADSTVSISVQQSKPTDGTFGVNLKLPENTVVPYTTWSGNAGFSRLDYMETARYFTWSIDVTPVSVLPLVFAGQVDIYTLSGTYKGTVYFSGEGAGKASGTDPCISLTKGTTYTAKFSGEAVNTDGQVFNVVPNAALNFYYR